LQIFKNKPCVCIASGPSLSTADISYIHSRDVYTIVVSDCFRLLPEADILYSCDAKWWASNPDTKNFMGIKFSLQKTPDKSVICMENGGRYGVSLEWPYLRTGDNSGYQAVNLAILLGAKKIILTGYDMDYDAQGKSHWFGNHKTLINPPINRLKQFAANFNTLADDLMDDIKIINCSIHTKITAFKQANIKDVI